MPRITLPVDQSQRLGVVLIEHRAVDTPVEAERSPQPQLPGHAQLSCQGAGLHEGQQHALLDQDERRIAVAELVAAAGPPRRVERRAVATVEADVDVVLAEVPLVRIADPVPRPSQAQLALGAPEHASEVAPWRDRPAARAVGDLKLDVAVPACTDAEPVFPWPRAFLSGRAERIETAGGCRVGVGRVSRRRLLRERRHGPGLGRQTRRKGQQTEHDSGSPAADSQAKRPSSPHESTSAAS